MARLLFIILFIPSIVFSHELKPSIANFQFIEKDNKLNFKLSIQLNLEAILANIDPSHSDTDESKNSDYYNNLRKLPAEQLLEVFKKSLINFKDNISLNQNELKIPFEVDDVQIDKVGDLNLSRETLIQISGSNIDKNNLQFGWIKDYGPIILRVSNPQKKIVYTEYLKINSVSKKFSITKNKDQNLFAEIYNYLTIGFLHIVPKGLDHILFVIGLFLFSPKFKPLLIQVSAFTLAHTITIFLGVLNILSISPQIVEPIIALSIAYVAIENIFLKNISLWRPMVVFVFGLLHGLGFAGVISEIGLSQVHFITSLISFNIGVEIGQLFVIVGCYFGFAYWIKEKSWYKKYFTNTLSIIIALVGVYWFIERVI